MIDTSRHASYFNPVKHNIPITIIGAGATGSRVFEALVNLGMKQITVFDDDIVEVHNLSNQLYGAYDVGHSKVDALGDWFRNKTGSAISAEKGIKLIHERIEGDMKRKMHQIVFLLTDSMASRSEIASSSLWLNSRIELVIETRMAIAHGNIALFNPNNLSEYKAWWNSLIDDDEGEESACGSSLSVGTTASIIANMAVNMMMNYLIVEDRKCIDKHCDIILNPVCFHAY